MKLGTKSLKELKGVHPDLASIVKRAIQLTTQDFTVYDGVRTMAEQKEFVRKGFSKTLKSRHLPQKDGLGYAVDLPPYINGMARWEWDAIWPIAMAMSKAAKELDLRLTWGGVWDKKMHEYKSDTIAGLKAEVEAYKVRQKKRNPKKGVFLDGPHYQLEK